MKNHKLLKSIIVLSMMAFLAGCGKKEEPIEEPVEDLGSLEDVLDAFPDTSTESTVPSDVVPVDTVSGDTVSEDSVSADAVSENEVPAENPSALTVPEGKPQASVHSSQTGPAKITIMNMCGYDLTSVKFSFAGITADGIPVQGDKKLKDGGYTEYSLAEADIYRQYLPLRLTVTCEAKGLSEDIVFPEITILDLDDLTVILSYYDGTYVVETN